MLGVHDKDAKVSLAKDWSSLDEIISPPFFIMSDQFERQSVLAFALGHLLKALLDSRVGWVIRLLYPSEKQEVLSAEDIISLNSQAFPQHTKLPDNFLEVFKDLPEVPMKNMLRQLDWKDIYNLQLIAGPFSTYIENGRRNYQLNQLIQGIVSLNGTDSVTVVRFQKGGLTINHEQFSRSLRSVHLRTMLIKQNGTLRASSFHIPELKCSKLDLRFCDPIDEDPEADYELAQILEQVMVNPNITSLTLIARRNENPRELSNRLNEIVRDARHLNPAMTRISIVPP